MWRQGFVIAVVAFLADRITKWWVLNVLDLDRVRHIEILPFLDFRMVWNRGISMGLFQADGETGRWVLIVLTSLVALFLLVWLFRVQNRILAIALGMVLGGAFGNIWDRISYGAVADFVHLHAGSWSFYIFNVADSAITIGVILLLADALLLPQKQPKRPLEENGREKE